MSIEEIINSFPEPFRTAAKQARFSFDYTLKGDKSDHRWLKGHGYEAHMANDCSYYINNPPNLSEELNIVKSSHTTIGTFTTYCL